MIFADIGKTTLPIPEFFCNFAPDADKQKTQAFMANSRFKKNWFLSRRGFSIFALVASALLFAYTDYANGQMAMEFSRQEPSLRDGDLLFCLSESQSGSFASAIGEVTDGNIYHVAIVARDSAGQVSVIEATTGLGVCERPLEDFLADCHHDSVGNPLVKIGRLKNCHDASRFVSNARKHLGKPYDYQYLEGDSAIYCSELIHYSFTSSEGKPLFPQQPMSFRDADGRLPEFWKEWYAKWNMEVPEGAPGTNPVSISRSPSISILPLLH